MKKYFAVAVALAAVAFLSMSYLANAEPDAAAPAATADSVVVGTPGPDTTAPAPEMTAYDKDFAECEALASAATTEGAAPSEEAKAAACKKCMLGKGHTEEEIMKEDEKRKAAAAAAAPAPAEAPAAAPAAEGEKH